MKSLGKLKLNEFRKTELEKRELNALKGGCSCKCGCVTVSFNGQSATTAQSNTGSSSAVTY
jgi:natural product precursor